MFGAIRPRGCVLCEHMFCSHRTSKVTQRARDALALTRAFLLLEDDDPVDWEVGEEERAAASHEPTWAPAHRAALGGWRTPRRGGQPAAPPQVCLCATRQSTKDLSHVSTDPKRNIPVTSGTPKSPFVAAQNQSICRAFAEPAERSAMFYAEPPRHA